MLDRSAPYGILLVVRIRFCKLSDERHVLEIERGNGARERVTCETRSYLVHDLLHFAVESEAQLSNGFWGLLARGKTLADMNDRSGTAMGVESSELPLIEQIVGALSDVVKGRGTSEIVEALRSYARLCETVAPTWITEAFIDGVRERMRQLVGRWKATPVGSALELEWPLV